MIERLQIELGEADDTLAKVTVRPQLDPAQLVHRQLTFTGSLRGPYCSHAHTLPAEFALRQVADTKEPVLEATVIDPCYWSEELPMEYEVEVQSQEGGVVQDDHRCRVGFRRREKNGGENWSRVRSVE